MGEILAASPPLADDYGHILLSYALTTGRADNHIEHGPLRRGVYWGIGRLALADAAVCLPAVALLLQGLRDEDMPCRGVAAWALAGLARRRALPPDIRPALAGALSGLEDNAAVCEVLQGTEFLILNVADLAASLRATLNNLPCAAASSPARR
jgi:hypothetical protein